MGKGGWGLMLRCASGCLAGTGAGRLILWDYREGCKLSSYSWPWGEAVQEKWGSVCPVSPWAKVRSHSGAALLGRARVGTGPVSRRGSSSPGVGGSEGAGGSMSACRSACPELGAALGAGIRIWSSQEDLGYVGSVWSLCKLTHAPLATATPTLLIDAQPFCTPACVFYLQLEPLPPAPLWIVSLGLLLILFFP